jgi:hypothetical protein
MKVASVRTAGLCADILSPRPSSVETSHASFIGPCFNKKKYIYKFTGV